MSNLSSQTGGNKTTRRDSGSGEDSDGALRRGGRNRPMSAAGAESVSSMSDLRAVGTVVSSSKQERKTAVVDGVSANDVAVATLQAVQDLARLIATNNLPSPANIRSSSGKSSLSNSSSLVAGLRSASKRTTGASAAPTTVAAAVPLAQQSATTHDDGDADDDDADLADVGVDGEQDEPTAAASAAALSTRLADGQCIYVDAEHDGKFGNWCKDTKWKSSFEREAKLMCRIADACRAEDGVDESTSEVMEIVCCRIAALHCMNDGDGSAVADIIEQKHHKSIVPQSVRMAAIKQANMLNRTKAAIKVDKNVKGGDKKGNKKNVNVKRTGGYAGKASGTTGAKK